MTVTQYLRPLTAADAEAMRQLRLLGLKTDAGAFGASYETESQQPLSFFEERCRRRDDKVFFGGFVDNQLVALCSIVREKAPKCRHHASIFAVFTHPDFRGRGLSKALLQRCIEQAREWQGVDYLQLGVATGNRAALQMYQQAGFEIWGTMPAALRVDGVDYDEHCMSLKLA